VAKTWQFKNLGMAKTWFQKFKKNYDFYRPAWLKRGFHKLRGYYVVISKFLSWLGRGFEIFSPSSYSATSLCRHVPASSKPNAYQLFKEIT
jgi:hypothetical protein